MIEITDQARFQGPMMPITPDITCWPKIVLKIRPSLSNFKIQSKC